MAKCYGLSKYVICEDRCWFCIVVFGIVQFCRLFRNTIKEQNYTHRHISNNYDSVIRHVVKFLTFTLNCRSFCLQFHYHGFQRLNHREQDLQVSISKVLV